ncbi:unnamed protein product [Echinostoma caproni]|uniref:Exocyst complex component Sec8 n=1 Tax=Echinostoma caproni TaxID=27848 RepID=A0A183AUY1_9TREM|nr:unnamed protein product [Echinostoma caproni]
MPTHRHRPPPVRFQLCSKNTVWVLDQLYSLDAKWIVTCNHCVLVSRKLLTELFDRFAACSEGAKHLTEFLQLLLSYSAERLDSLTDQLTSTEHYLRPIYAADYSHNDAHYTSKCEEQFTKLRDSAKQTHEELKNVWNVKRSTILNAIGLHADEYAAYRSEEQVFGRSHHISDESSGLAAPPPRQGALSAEISDILSEQESRLLQLLDLTDTGLITFIHLIDQFLLDLNCGRDNGSRLYPTLDQYEKKIGTWKNILPIKRNKTEHLKNQQGTASPDGRDPLVNLQTNLFQRLSDLNFVLAHCIRVQEQRMVLCDQSAIGWITRSLVHFCVRPEWIVKLQEQKCESDEISSVASTPSPGSTSNIITEIGMDDVESEELSPNRELDRTAPASQELEPQLDPVMMRQYQSRYERILRDFDSRVLLFALAKDITEIQTVVDRIVSHFNTLVVCQI